MSTDHSRLLPVPGALNIRDLGGYRTRRGHVTRWRSLYRGDSPHLMPPEGDAVLRVAGLRSVIDLRSGPETQDEPNPLAAAPGVAYHPIPLFDDLAPTIRDIKARNSDDLLLDLYMEALNAQSGAVHAVLATIAAAPEGAVLFHCTAGKDRTGMAAALLLGALDVDRDTVMEDYLLTNQRYRRDAAWEGQGPEHVMAILWQVQEAFLNSAFETIDHHFGGLDAYLEGPVGLHRMQREALRQRLLA